MATRLHCNLRISRFGKKKPASLVKPKPFSVARPVIFVPVRRQYVAAPVVTSGVDRAEGPRFLRCRNVCLRDRAHAPDVLQIARSTLGHLLRSGHAPPLVTVERDRQHEGNVMGETAFRAVCTRQGKAEHFLVHNHPVRPSDLQTQCILRTACVLEGTTRSRLFCSH